MLSRLGYAQELRRRMGGFSNFAISMSAICILSGGVTSFHLGFCSVGGAAIGLGWPLVALFSLVVAATLGQVASAFPTAGGLYHWSSILGGRGWGWVTAWFNLAGLVTVLAAINVGTCAFALGTLGPRLGYTPEGMAPGSAFHGPGDRRALDHRLAGPAQSPPLPAHDRADRPERLVDRHDRAGTFRGDAGVRSSAGAVALIRLTNYSGAAGGGVWPATANLAWLFVLGFLLPAYTITGFDASAHAAEETVGAAETVPRGMVRSVAVSGVAGWVLLSAVVLAIPNLDEAAARGEYLVRLDHEDRFAPGAGTRVQRGHRPGPVRLRPGGHDLGLADGIRFRARRRSARLPGLGWVCPTRKTPVVAIWGVAALVVLFTLSTRVYATITVVCTIFLYLSYMLPTALGAWAYGRSWTTMGPWDLGRVVSPARLCECDRLRLAHRPRHAASLRPGRHDRGRLPRRLGVAWFGSERHRFRGPPTRRWTRSIPSAVLIE